MPLHLWLLLNYDIYVVFRLFTQSYTESQLVNKNTIPLERFEGYAPLLDGVYQMFELAEEVALPILGGIEREHNGRYLVGGGIVGREAHKGASHKVVVHLPPAA